MSIHGDRYRQPLFVPLKREYFEACERDEKDREYRPHGKRWNSATLWPGRPAILSLGYSGRRLYTTIKRWHVIPRAQTSCPPGLYENVQDLAVIEWGPIYTEDKARERREWRFYFVTRVKRT